MLHLRFWGKASLWCHHNNQVSCIYKIFKQRKSFGWTNLETNCYDNLIWIHKPYGIWLTWLTKPYLIKHMSHYKALFSRVHPSWIRGWIPPDLRRLLKNGSTKAESVMPRRKNNVERGDGTSKKRQRGFVGWCVFCLFFSFLADLWMSRIHLYFWVSSSKEFKFAGFASLVAEMSYFARPFVASTRDDQNHQQIGWGRLVACGRGTCIFFWRISITLLKYLGSWVTLKMRYCMLFFLVNMINHLTILLWILREVYRLSRTSPFCNCNSQAGYKMSTAENDDG